VLGRHEDREALHAIGEPEHPVCDSCYNTDCGLIEP
jgi:hypothetical protein